MTAEEDVSADIDPVDTMTLTEHLAELRVRIIRSALAISIGMVLIIAFYDQVLDFLKQPYVDLCARKAEDFCDPQLNNFTPTEGLATRVRVGLYGGIIAALPVIMWQVWRFIGMHELRQLTIGVALGSVLATAVILMLRLPNFPRKIGRAHV